MGDRGTKRGFSCGHGIDVDDPKQVKAREEGFCCAALVEAQAHNELTHALVYDDLATFTGALLSGALDLAMQACRQASGAG